MQNDNSKSSGSDTGNENDILSDDTSCSIAHSVPEDIFNRSEENG